MSHTWTHPNPWLSLFEPKRDEPVQVLTISEDEPRTEKVLICINCSTAITSDRYRMAVNGSHEHNFFNPHGIVYEIGCFEQASGCKPVSGPSDEFSWFPGYQWRIVCCHRCQAHLGWDFLLGGLPAFYGLILNRLTSGED